MLYTESAKILGYKTLLCILTAALLSPTYSMAQSSGGSAPVSYHTTAKDSIPKPLIGVKIGAASSYLSGNLAFNQAYTPGITAGAYMEFRRKKYGLQMEGQIATAMHSLQDSFINGGTLHFIYLDIPVLFEYRLFPGLWVQAGPQIGTLISVTQNPGTIVAPKTLFESNNFSGVIGLEGKLPHRFSIGARYVAGISNINNGNVLNPSQAWSTTSIQFYLGYGFL